MDFSSVRYGDLYTKFYESNGLIQGSLQGTGNGFTFNNAILLYGRVSGIIYTMPESIRNAVDLSKNTFVTFDLFAYQEAQDSPVLYTAGRVALLFPYKFTDVNFTPIVTAVLCNIYGAQQSFSTYSSTANLVTACLFQYSNHSVSVQPVTFAPASYMNLTSEDVQYFLNNFINCEKMITVYDVMPVSSAAKPLRLGLACALLLNSNENHFAYYSKDRGTSFKPSGKLASRRSLESVMPTGPATSSKKWFVSAELVTKFAVPRQLDFNSTVKNNVSTPNINFIANIPVFSDAKPVPEIYSIVEANLSSAYDRMKNKLTMLNDAVASEDLIALMDNLCIAILKYIEKNYKSKDATGKTGAARFKQILKYYSRIAEDFGYLLMEDFCDIVKSVSFEDIVTSLFDFDDICVGEVSAEIQDWVFATGFSSNNLKFILIFGFVWSALGLRSSFMPLLNVDNLSAVYYLVKNPYVLAIMCPNLSLGALDKIANFMGVIKDTAILEDRLVACMHSTILTCSDETGSTIFKYSELSNKLNLSFGAAERDAMPGSLLSQGTITLSMTVFKNIIPALGIDKYKLPRIMNYDFATAVTAYVESGFGLYFIYNDCYYLMDISHALMFVDVCNYFMNDCSSDIYCADFTKTVDADSCIAEFELEKSRSLKIPNFKLEPEQAEVRNLVKYPNACLIGPAGSGKTTSLELLIKLLRRQRSDFKIQMAAPTGMAARRMTECTRDSGCDPARTLHSLLRIESTVFDFVSRPQPIEQLDSRINEKTKPDIVILDECSMISLNLLYYVVNRYRNIKPRFILVGDIKQLPPIETGKPFVDLLTFLPTVCLKVSKRAATGSNITRIADALNNRRLADITWTADSDAILLPCAESQFEDTCKELLSYYIKGIWSELPLVNNGMEYSAKDIQIVTPLATQKYSWSTTSLNEAVRELFNPAKDSRGAKKAYFSYTLGNNELLFRVGDRVINTQNDYHRNRYLPFDIAKHEVPIAIDRGIVNGDIGYIKYICWASDIPHWYTQFIQSEGAHVPLADMAEDTVAEAYWKPIRNKFNDRLDDVQPLCIFVEFYDTNNMPYWVAFRCTASTSSCNATSAELWDSEDVRSLSLAYAITVHKMQGSQAKLIITPMYKCGRGTFLSRNLVYTAWTRAESGLYVIGDVAHTQASALGRAISVDAVAPRISPFDIK